MGKGVSVSRRILRLQLGVNRKLTVVRWIGCATVGVVNTTSTRLKANEGAEKSCSKRRKRGQRKGSVRSRGCHPRRTPPVPAPVSDQPTSRTIARILRTYDHWGKRAKQFETLFSRTSHLGLFDRSSTSYPAWRTRWRTLFRRIEESTNKVFATAKLQTSFLEWLVWVGKVNIPVRDVRNKQTGVRNLFDFVEEIRPIDLGPPRDRKRPIAKKLGRSGVPDQEPYQIVVGRRITCSYCRREAPIFRLHSCFQRYQRSRGNRQR